MRNALSIAAQDPYPQSTVHVSAETAPSKTVGGQNPGEFWKALHGVAQRANAIEE